MTTALTALLFHALAFCLLAAPAMADPIARVQGFTINADEMDRDTEADIVDLRGRVQIISSDQHLQADTARIHLRTRRVELEGDVKVTTPKSTIGGQRILLDYENGTGLIYNGYVQSGPVIFEGALLQKTGPDEYYVVDADYTACTNCPAAWSFKGSSIRAELGGYAYIKNSILNIGPVPVIWLPYLIVPLKSDRQSGLLTPEFEQSSAGGLAIAQPFFWAISRNTDATLTFKNYELRGQKGLANYRYVLNETSEGELNVGYLRDRVFQGEDRLNRFRQADQKNTPVNRWFLKYNHYQELPEGWVHRAVLNNASDLQYPRDFPSETLNHGDSAMENRISMTQNTRTRHLSIDSSYYINLLQGNPLAGNDDAVHRLPEIRWAQIPQAIGQSGFVWGLDLNLTNFTRAGPAYDDLFRTADGSQRYISNTCNGTSNGIRYGSLIDCTKVEDGIYNSGTDLIRTGQRFDLQPTLSRPFSVADILDVNPMVAYRETYYNFAVGDERNNIRRMLRAELNTRASFIRIFGDTSSPKGTRYKHEIRPEITYTSVPWINHNSHPFFGFKPQTEAPTFEGTSVGDSDLFGDSGLQFDYRDRIYDRNLMTYSIVNTLTEKKWVNDTPVYRQLALISIAQSYDASKSSSSNPNAQPWSEISTTADLRFDNVQSYSIFNYYPYQKVTNTSSRVRVNDSLGRFAQLGLVKSFTIVPGQDVDASTRVEDYTLSAGFVARYLNLMGKLTYDANAGTNRPRVKSQAYVAQFKPPGDCWLVSLIYDQVTGGDRNVKLNMEFTFDGIPKPPLSESVLDTLAF